ncbi:hypothetical protein Prudu_473S000200 [Prunus dulcis]|uniref:Uncharacterized protein n=1 Tax=Prunus dulcis TaxID=3755 RepID=A0A5H2XNH2_PRUDU|nr:hypothetical protein Prudu_473S000200 [Prunus dulcis]
MTQDLKWTSPIVHGLLLRKVDPKTVFQVNGIKFIVGNKVIQFTAQQFCIVTGLRKNLLEWDDVLKLGFVYFAVFVLLGGEKHVHIDMRYLKLAEDLEEFGKYPRGAVCYVRTNASLLRALCAYYHVGCTTFGGARRYAYIPRILHWRSNTSAHFYERMSQVFENREVDVELLRQL